MGNYTNYTNYTNVITIRFVGLFSNYTQTTLKLHFVGNIGCFIRVSCSLCSLCSYPIKSTTLFLICVAYLWRLLPCCA